MPFFVEHHLGRQQSPRSRPRLSLAVIEVIVVVTDKFLKGSRVNILRLPQKSYRCVRVPHSRQGFRCVRPVFLNEWRV